jgi:hypothetical protein
LDRPLRKLAPILVAALALAGCTIPAPPGEGPLRDLLHEQADYFLYFMMDLAHAAR